MSEREFVDGATAVARGALDAGCNFFAGYPISPATPLLLHMIRELPRTGGIAIQAEDEIASISMCIGAAMTGARVLTASSGPGLSLYSENVGLAIMGEVPLVIVDVQRMGPATGGATTVAQGDVQFARWGTSGGYPIIALSPAGVTECYSLTRRAFDLAEQFRVPVFLLTDKEVFLSMSTVAPQDYARPPVRQRAFAPIGGPTITRFTGSTHDERGMLTKDPAAVARLNAHLVRKIEDHAGEIALVGHDPEAGAKTLLIAYGVTARGMKEAVLRARESGRKVSALTLTTLWPFPDRALIEALDGIERVVVAELNHGDVRREVERVVHGAAARSGRPAPEIVGLNRVDGALLEPGQFLEAIRP